MTATSISAYLRRLSFSWSSTCATFAAGVQQRSPTTGKATMGFRWLYDGEAKEGFIRLVDDWSAATLLPIIQATIAAGSHIMSDERVAYTVGSVWFIPILYINHSQNFRDSADGIFTNHRRICRETAFQTYVWNHEGNGASILRRAYMTRTINRSNR